MTKLDDLREKLRQGEAPVHPDASEDGKCKALGELAGMANDKWAYLPLLVEGLEVLRDIFDDDENFGKWQDALLSVYEECVDKKCVHCHGAPVPPSPVVQQFKPPGAFIGDLDLKKLPSSGDGLIDAAMATPALSKPKI